MNFILVKNGSTVDLLAVEVKQRSFYSNMGRRWEMGLFLSARVGTLLAIFPYHFGRLRSFSKPLWIPKLNAFLLNDGRRKNKVYHCHIRTRQEWGRTKYYLIEPNCYDSLYSLILHYKSHPLRSPVRDKISLLQLVYQRLHWIISLINLTYRVSALYWTILFLSLAPMKTKIGTTLRQLEPEPKSYFVGFQEMEHFWFDPVKRSWTLSQSLSGNFSLER